MEIMVALAIMGLSLVILIQAQSRSILLAQEAQSLIVASELARIQLAECTTEIQKHGFSVSDFTKNGDFSEFDRPEFAWECYSYRYNLPMPTPDQVQQGIKAQQSGEMPDMSSGMGAMMAPFMEIIGNTMGESVREVALVVRWKNGEFDESMRIVTHLVDTSALKQLLTMMAPPSSKKEDSKKDSNKPRTGKDAKGKDQRTQRQPNPRRNGINGER